MRTQRIALVVVAVLTLLAPVARAQEAFTSVGGPWWFKLGGKDKGALIVEFSEPNAGAFTVKDVALNGHPSFGFSRELAAFFQVAADQALALDAKGNVSGTLVLTAVGSADPVGTLIVEKGKPNKKFTKLNLRATIEGAGGMPLVVKLSGARLPPAFPVLSGQTAEGAVKGKGVKGSALDLGVTSDGELGFPAYSWTCDGSLEIDKTPADASFAGHFMLDPKFKAHGLLESSSAFGTGLLKGKLVAAGKTATVPKLALTVEADRKLSVKGTLSEPIEPVLQVTPLSKAFGAIHLNELRMQAFELSNVGVGTLSGTATFLEGSDPDFLFTGETEYGPLAPGDPPVQIFVRFDPGSVGDKTATVRFGVDTFVGARVVPLTGTGGLAVIDADPNPVSFDDTTVGTPRTIVVTVENDGDGPLTGAATLAGSNAFALIAPPGNQPLNQISYSLEPGEERMITIRFQPTALGEAEGTLNLTGGGGLAVPLDGTGE